MKSQTFRFAFQSRAAIFAGIVAWLAPLQVARAAEPAPASAAVPIVSTDEQVRKDLLELDRTLDANPKLAEILSANMDQITQDSFRAKNPDVDALIKKQPGIVAALKTERHFLLHRSIARMDRGPLMRADAIKLDDFLTAHPDISQPLEKRPRLIADPAFLTAHPALATFLDQHPGLSTVLLENAGKTKKAGAKAPAAITK